MAEQVLTVAEETARLVNLLQTFEQAFIVEETARPHSFLQLSEQVLIAEETARPHRYFLEWSESEQVFFAKEKPSRLELIQRPESESEELARLLTLYRLLQDLESRYQRSSWLTLVLQTPIKSLKNMKSFLQASGFFYLVFGLMFLLIPEILVEMTSQATDFCRLGGVYLAEVGVIYVASARFRPINQSINLLHSLAFPVNYLILGSLVIPRIVFLNFKCWTVYVRHNGWCVFLFSVIIMGYMDTVLARIIYYFWPREPNFQIYVADPWSYEEVLLLLLPDNLTRLSKSSAVVQLIGYAQVAMGTTLLLRPGIAQTALQLDPFDVPYAFVIIGFAVIGWLHVMGGAADSLWFNAVAVFYRVFFSVPVVFCLAMWNCIPGNLVLFLVGFDVLAACSVCICLSCCKKPLLLSVSPLLKDAITQRETNFAGVVVD